MALLINMVILSAGDVIMGVVEKDEGQYDTVIPVFWGNGGSVVYPAH